MSFAPHQHELTDADAQDDDWSPDPSIAEHPVWDLLVEQLEAKAAYLDGVPVEMIALAHDRSVPCIKKWIRGIVHPSLRRGSGRPRGPRKCIGVVVENATEKRVTPPSDRGPLLIECRPEGVASVQGQDPTSSAPARPGPRPAVPPQAPRHTPHEAAPTPSKPSAHAPRPAGPTAPQSGPVRLSPMQLASMPGALAVSLVGEGDVELDAVEAFADLLDLEGARAHLIIEDRDHVTRKRIARHVHGTVVGISADEVINLWLIAEPSATRGANPVGKAAKPIRDAAGWTRYARKFGGDEFFVRDDETRVRPASWLPHLDSDRQQPDCETWR